MYAKSFPLAPYKTRLFKNSIWTFAFSFGIAGFTRIGSLFTFPVELFYGFLWAATLFSTYFLITEARRQKHALASLTIDGNVAKVEYYKFSQLCREEIKIRNLELEIRYHPLEKNSDLHPYIRIRKGDQVIGNFYSLAKSEIFELSYQVTKAKHNYLKR